MAMKAFTNQLNQDRRIRFESKTKELLSLRDTWEANKERIDVLRASLEREMELMGMIGHGDRLTIAELGISVQVHHQDNHRIDEETLLSLGVSKDIVDKAKVYWEVKRHIRVRKPKNNTTIKCSGVTNGVTNSISEPKALESGQGTKVHARLY